MPRSIGTEAWILLSGTCTHVIKALRPQKGLSGESLASVNNVVRILTASIGWPVYAEDSLRVGGVYDQ